MMTLRYESVCSALKKDSYSMNVQYLHCLTWNCYFCARPDLHFIWMCQIKGGLNKSESYAGWKSLRFDFRIFQVWRSLENYLHLFSCSKICFLPCVFVSLLFHFFFLTDFLSSLLSLLSFICSTFRLSFFLYSLLLCCSFFDCFFFCPFTLYHLLVLPPLLFLASFLLSPLCISVFVWCFHVLSFKT